MAVYFLRDFQGHIKIGFANDPSARCQTLQAGHINPLELIRTVPGNIATERWYHQRFQSQHICRDWFQFHEDMLSEEAPQALAEQRRRPNGWWKPTISVNEFIQALRAFDEAH